MNFGGWKVRKLKQKADVGKGRCRKRLCSGDNEGSFSQLLRDNR